jgi:energy-coupling factor transporter ATP-binding protein EcfA2
MQLTFPSKSPGTDTIIYEGKNRFVLIGANGSGKTRFGIWLEDNNHNSIPVHRIGAQKALSIPEYAPLLNAEQAEKSLLFGRTDVHATVGNKKASRWHNEPATFLISDFDKVLSLLFARTAERDHKYTQNTRLTERYEPVPDSPIDSIMKVWGDLMPHRSVSLYDGKVVVDIGKPTEYHGKDMSDGERVVLYLLGQCFCAPTNSIIIIDEPELHLHKSLMDKLWNKVEELCPDKALVYITHDLDFAASRAGATKIWVQSYSENSWTWAEVPSDDTLPEALVLELIGNRKPILICEGERGGLDHTIYQLCYPHLHVVPRGGSEKVIETTKALRGNTALHTLLANGIIDRDVRSDNECAALVENGLHILELAEVENLFCLEAVVRLTATKLSLDQDTTVKAVQEYLFAAFSEELEAQIVMHAERRIRYLLSKYSKASSDEKGLEKGLANLLSGVSIPAITRDAKTILNTALASKNLDQMLRVYNRKSLAERISTCFGFKHGEYPDFVIRSMKCADGSPFVKAIRNSLPRF